MNKKALKSEVIKCGQDPAYFIENYIKIQHPVHGLIPFKLYDYQKELIKSYQQNRFNIVLKARQLGASETTAAYATWLLMFRRDKNILVMATQKEVAKNIIRKVKVAIENIPKWLFLSKIIVDNVFSVEFSSGSRIKAISRGKDAARSEAVSLLIVDEAAHVEGMDEIWTGVYPTISAGGSAIMLSTPKGTGNLFHLLYTQAENNENEFKPHKFLWWMHPERIQGLMDDPYRPGFKTSEWFKNETKGMSPREVAQELECSFLGSGDNFIAHEHIDFIEKNTCLEPISFEFWDRNVFVWEDVKPNKIYFITADVARGDGSDYSACQVIDLDTLAQVAEYNGKLPPDQFANLLCKLGYQYNTALLIVENNTFGYACLDHIKLYSEDNSGITGYPNVYFSDKTDFKMGRSVNTTVPLYEEGLVQGLTTTSKTRPLMLEKLEEYIRTRKISIRSKRFAEQVKKFVWVNGKPQASAGSNDDMVIAMAIACWMKHTFYSNHLSTSQYSEKMVGALNRVQTNITAIPGASTDPITTRMTERSFNRAQNPYVYRMPNGNLMDISWLVDKK